MAEFNWDSLPDAPTDASQAPQTQQDAGFDWNAVPDANDKDISNAKYGTPIQGLTTAVEQAASGLTMGGSKIAETKLLGVNPEDIAGREQAWPVTSVLSNMAGTGAMLAGTEGLGLAVKGGGLAAKAGSVMLQGGIIGGTNEAADEWSQNKPLDAQKIIANAGIGSALGLTGETLIGAGKAAPSTLRSALNWFGKFAPESDISNGTSTIGGKIRDAYDMTMEGTDRNSLARELKTSLSDLYKQSKDNVDFMYNEAGNKALTDTLAPISSERMMENTKSIIDEVQNVLETPGSYETGENVLSQRAKAQVNRKLEILQQNIDPESNINTHNALTEFTKDISDMIKWEGKNAPTDQGRIDQEVLHQINTTIRDNLKNTQIWGNTGQVFTDLSDAFHAHASAVKDFEKAFTVPFNGNRVVSPVKINDFLAKSGSETQALKTQALNNFLTSSAKVAQTSENLSGMQEATQVLSENIKKLAANVSDTNVKSSLINAAKKLDNGHSLTGADFALFETLGEIPGAKPVMAAWRVLQHVSPTGVGKLTANSVKLAMSIAKYAESSTQKIEKYARGIFTGSSSQFKKKED